MDISAIDSVNLTEAQALALLHLCNQEGVSIDADTLDLQREEFSLVSLVLEKDTIRGFLFCSLERVGGTPSVLWGLGVVVSEHADLMDVMLDEMYRRAAISFPDEDVLVGGRFTDPKSYSLLLKHHDVAPRLGYKASGEERAWGKRLAKRYGVAGSYDEHSFMVDISGQGDTPQVYVSAKKKAPKKANDLFIDLSDDQSLIACGWILAEELEKVLKDVS